MPVTSSAQPSLCRGKVKQDEYFGGSRGLLPASASHDTCGGSACWHASGCSGYLPGFARMPGFVIRRSRRPFAMSSQRRLRLPLLRRRRDQAVAVSATAGGASSGSTSGASASSKSNAGSGSAPGATAAPATRLAKGASAAPAMVSEQDRLTSLLAGG